LLHLLAAVHNVFRRKAPAMQVKSCSPLPSRAAVPVIILAGLIAT
jgi:hypothetical protein